MGEGALAPRPPAAGGLRKRIVDPEDNWKFDAGDYKESLRRDEYLDAYQDALRATSKPWAPWYAIPADNKPFMRRTVAEIVAGTLERLPLEYPEPNDEAREEMERVKRALEAG